MVITKNNSFRSVISIIGDDARVYFDICPILWIQKYVIIVVKVLYYTQ